MGYYNYEFGDNDRETRFLKQMPQFFDLTEEEIQRIMASIDLIEIEEARRALKEKLITERMEDAAYLESTKDPVLSSDPVVLQLGVKIAPSMVGTDGFIASEDLLRCKTGWKLSIGKKKIYL